MPLRLLRRKDCANILKEFTEMLDAYPNRICCEIPPQALDDDGGYFRESMHKLRKAGYHTMLSSIGSESFPVFKLAELEPEYVMLNEELTRMLGTNRRSDTCVKSVISLINDLGAEPIASGVTSSEKADMLYDMECSFYTGDELSGDNSGSFIAERFIRRRNQV